MLKTAVFLAAAPATAAGSRCPMESRWPTSSKIDRMAAPRTREWMICAVLSARAAPLSAAPIRQGVIRAICAEFLAAHSSGVHLL